MVVMEIPNAIDWMICLSEHNNKWLLLFRLNMPNDFNKNIFLFKEKVWQINLFLGSSPWFHDSIMWHRTSSDEWEYVISFVMWKIFETKDNDKKRGVISFETIEYLSHFH